MLVLYGCHRGLPPSTVIDQSTAALRRRASENLRFLSRYSLCCGKRLPQHDPPDARLAASRSAAETCMPRVFWFEPAHYEAPTIAELRQEWCNIPLAEARNVIAVENQYLHFHHYLIAAIRHQSIVGGPLLPLGLSLRAGALKAASLICASIAEAALCAHAEVRGYELPRKPWQRTFGKVLRAWQDKLERPRADVAEVWSELQRLHSGRNDVHLYRAAADGNDFYAILAAEEASVHEAQRVIAHLKDLRSVG
jgi:hypothetical protein